MSQRIRIDLVWKRVGARVRALREEEGLTQEQLARRSGIGRTSITNIEVGRQRPPLSTLIRIARVCGEDPACFLEGF